MHESERAPFQALIERATRLRDEQRRTESILDELERTLAGGNIRVVAQSDPITEDTTVEYGNAYRQLDFLAYGSVHGSFRIHRRIEVWSLGEFDELIHLVKVFERPWRSLSLEEQQELVDHVDELLDDIETRMLPLET